MVQGGMSCIKYLLFVFNFIFVVSGIALIVVGAIVQSTGKDYTTFLDSKFVTAPTILITVGCLIFLLAFLGCCGAIKENHCMVLTFGILLFIIFIIEIAGGITAYMYKGQFEDFVKSRLNDTFIQQKEFVNSWDEMQANLKCCGLNGKADYGTLIPNPSIPPPSCCGKEAKECSFLKAYNTGCFEALKDKLKSDIGMVGGVGIGIAVIELIGVMFAWCLASAIKKEYEGV